MAAAVDLGTVAAKALGEGVGAVEVEVAEPPVGSDLALFVNPS